MEHVALLARIALSEEEKDLFSEQLSTILDFFDTIKEVDTEGVPPTSHVGGLVNVFRDDRTRPSLDTDQALSNAPDAAAGRFFRVPRILD